MNSFDHLTAGQLVAVLRRDQQQRWQQGDRTPAEVYLEQYETLVADPESAVDFIYSEFCLREDLGETPDPKEYLKRFPQYTDQLVPLFEVHQALDRTSLLERSRKRVSTEPAAHRETSTDDEGSKSRPRAKPGEVRQDQSLTDSADLHLASTVLPPSSDRPGTPQSTRPLTSEALPTFGEKYELLEEMGRGGMGVVYKARQLKANRIVALKMILAGQLASAEEVRRFRTEAEAAAHLEHPNIVPMYELDEHEGQHYFSMGYVAGDTLSARVTEGPVPPREAAELVKTVSEAVAYAHERGIIHRDLKPANILLDHAGQPHVSDFGLAKRIEADSSLTGTGDILGTPSYMPPEQAAGKSSQVGPYSDVYSLGAILYYLLTGRPPFQAANKLETLKQVLEQEPVSPRLLNPAIDKDLETICLKCLEKEPQRRYGTIRAFVDDISRFLAGHPIDAQPLSHNVRYWRSRLAENAVRWCAAKKYRYLPSWYEWFSIRCFTRKRHWNEAQRRMMRFASLRHGASILLLLSLLIAILYAALMAPSVYVALQTANAVLAAWGRRNDSDIHLMASVSEIAPSTRRPVAEWLLDKVQTSSSTRVKEQAQNCLGRMRPPPFFLIPQLVDELMSEVPRRRSDAAKTLWLLRSGARPAIPALIEALSDEVLWDPSPHADRFVHRALGDLASDSDAVTQLVDALGNSNRNIGLIAHGLSRTNNENAYRAMLKALKHRNPQFRAIAAEAFGRIKPPVDRHWYCVRALIETVMRDADTRVRREAVRSLGTIGRTYAHRDIIAALMHALSDSDRGVRYQAIHALGAIGGAARAAVPVLAKACKDTDQGICSAAISAMGQIGAHPDLAVPMLVEVCRDSDVNSAAFAAAVEALGKLRQRPDLSIPVLGELSKNADVGVRAKARAALLKYTSLAIPAFVDAIRHADPNIRSWAIDSISRLESEAAASVPVLIECLADTDRSVRSSAANALGHIGPEARTAIPALIESLTDADSGIRGTAIRAIGNIGPEARTSIPSLFDALTDKDWLVRGWAAVALGKVGPNQQQAASAFALSLRDDYMGNAVHELSDLLPREIVLRELMEAFSDNDSRIRVSAVMALRNMELIDEADVFALREYIRKVGPFVNRSARNDHQRLMTLILALSPELEADKEAAITLLLKALKSDNSSFRAKVAKAIGRFGPSAEKAVPALVQALEDIHVDVRTSAAEALGRIGPSSQSGIARLVEALNSVDAGRRVRAAAAVALGKIDPGSKQVSSALQHALYDSDPQIVCAAAEGLVRLRLKRDGEKVRPQEEEKARVRNQATAEIKKLGGTLRVDKTRPDWPVVAVYLTRPQVTDAGLVHLKELSKVQTLNLSGTQVTDAGLVHLKRLSKLQTLYLSKTQVTNAGLMHLKGLTRLRVLNLDGTQVTDAGLVHLKELTEVERLSLRATKVTDDGLVHLKELTKLQKLYLSKTQVTNAGLAHLKGLTNLRWLYLNDTQVTDAGLVHLKELTELERLSLVATKVTNAGLVHLKALSRLQWLDHRGTRITWAGDEDLKQALPNCDIEGYALYVQIRDSRKKQEEIWEKILEAKPDDPSVNNNLGYLYAIQGKNLDRAEKMIRKAIKAEPENAGYLDSMGWVLFKLSKFNEALPYLEKAVKLPDGSRSTIWNHLGDCYYRLNKPAKATEAWQKALDHAKKTNRPDRKLIERLQEKLKNKKQGANKLRQGPGAHFPKNPRKQGNRCSWNDQVSDTTNNSWLYHSNELSSPSTRLVRHDLCLLAP